MHLAVETRVQGCQGRRKTTVDTFLLLTRSPPRRQNRPNGSTQKVRIRGPLGFASGNNPRSSEPIRTAAELCDRLWAMVLKVKQSSESTHPASALSFRTLAPLKNSSDGSVLLTKPYSEEREGGTNETVMGSPQKSHLVAVGSLFVWVGCILSCAQARLNFDLNSSLLQVVSLGLRRDRLFQRLAHNHKFAKAVRAFYT